MLGAYTRLSDAGLGCPDWPGCYGQLVLPHQANALAKAQATFPAQPIVAAKAWKEMVHRYFAGMLGILIAVLAIWAMFRRRHDKQQPIVTPSLLLIFVIFQAALGMWTVTLKLLPLVVTAHLVMGMIITALLYWVFLMSKPADRLQTHRLNTKLYSFALLGLLIVIGQIFLGAWASTHYAALACPHFPFCQGTLFPHMDWRAAFNFTSPIGPNYEGGQLNMQARITIQMTHRYGAFITTAYLIPFALYLMLSKTTAKLRQLAWLLLVVLATQITLGILNVELLLPMSTAVLHNGVAALLLLTMVTIIHRLWTTQREIFR